MTFDPFDLTSNYNMALDYRAYRSESHLFRDKIRTKVSCSPTLTRMRENMDVTGNVTSVQPLNVPFKIGEQTQQTGTGSLELRVEQATNCSHTAELMCCVEVMLALAILH